MEPDWRAPALIANELQGREDKAELHTLMLLGADPECPAELLQNLAKVHHPELEWTLACNPSTPDAELHRLFIKQPLAVLENPINDYKVLTQGRALYEFLPIEVKLALYSALRRKGRTAELDSLLPETERTRWFSSPEYQPDFAQLAPLHLKEAQTYLATDPSLKVRMALVDILPFDILFLFARDPQPKVRLRLAASERNGWYRHADSKDPVAQKFRDSIQRILATDEVESVRVELAGCTNLHPEVHQCMANDSSAKVRLKLAATSQYQSGIFEDVWHTLVAWGAEEARLVARNPSCPEKLRLELTGHSEARVRETAWQWMNLPGIQQSLAPVLAPMLANPARESEAIALAANRNIPDDVFARLAQCPPAITRKLAKNKHVNPGLRETFLTHSDSETAVLALKSLSPISPKVARKVMATGIKALRMELAALPGNGASQLRPQLAQDAEPEVRMAVVLYLTHKAVSYQGTNIDAALATLARDPDVAVRLAVAEDPRLLRESLEALSQDPNPRVRQRILERHGLKITTDLGLLDDANSTVREAAAEVLLSEKWGGKAALRDHYSERIAMDPCPSVRVLAALSAASSAPAMEKLTQDPDPAVQEALATRPLNRTLRPAWWQWAAIRQKNGSRVESLMQSKNPYLRAMAAALSEIGDRRLQRLSEDGNWFVRFHAVGNPYAEAPLLGHLVEDPHPLVSQRARARLQTL